MWFVPGSHKLPLKKHRPTKEGQHVLMTDDCTNVNLFLCLSVCLIFVLSVCLSVCLIYFLSVCLPAYSFKIDRPTKRTACPHDGRLDERKFVYLSVFISIFLLLFVLFLLKLTDRQKGQHVLMTDYGT